jgi:FkbM family methyltransferase
MDLSHMKNNIYLKQFAPWNLQEGDFVTLTPEGHLQLRNLKEEDKDFTVEKYHSGQFDSYNYLYHENFSYSQFDATGCDYLRHGCRIDSGMKVLDIGANIGAFARAAVLRGASKVYCFEPMTPTYRCLELNAQFAPDIIETFKLGVSDKSESTNFQIHTNYTHNGGGQMTEINPFLANVVHSETCALIDIRAIFCDKIWGDVDFLKIDIEGAEEIVLKAIPDAALQRLVCIAAEFHSHTPEFDIFQENFIQRCQNFGFKSFVLYHGDGHLRTINLWKN